MRCSPDAPRRRSRIGSALHTAAVVPLCLVLFGHPAAAQNEIPWDRSVVISRTSSGEDIRTALRSMLQTNGFSVAFAPNVAGTVSFRLEKMPLYAAFEQLVDENGLTYTFNPSTKTVNIAALGGSSNAGGAVLDARSSEFVPLDQVTFAELSRALASFGIPAQGIRYDAASNTVSITGDKARIDQVRQLIETLEDARAKQRERASTERTRELQIRQQELTQRVYEDLSRFQVKVVPLRFTDVGPTTRQFQGRAVTIPGIEDTLKAILGLDQPAGNVAIAQGENAAAQASGRAAQLGYPRISVDPRTNSVVIHGTPEAIAAIEKIIRELDRPLRMVEIEVMIATAEVGVAQQLGVAWRGRQAEGNFVGGAIDTGTTGGVLNPGANLDPITLLPTPQTAGATVASFVVAGTQGFLQAQLQALASNDKARVLSAPRLVTLDNITARITRSQNIYVQVDTRNPEGGGLGSVGLQEIQTGLTLEITPSIVPGVSDPNDAFVRLNLRAENSSPGSGVFGQIDVRSQEVQTNVLVPDGATFVIGGLFDDTQISQETGIPGLRDLPVIGSLFRDKTATKSLGETIFFITPRVIDENAVVQNDIAVKVGSDEYIRRERRSLGTIHDDFNLPPAPQPARGSALSTLEEDE